MPTLAKVTRNFQVTIPKAVREQTGIREGDLVSVEARDGDVVLRAQKVIDADQAWFETREWQERMQRAGEQFASGDVVGPFDSMADFVAHAEERVARRRAEEGR